LKSRIRNAVKAAVLVIAIAAVSILSCSYEVASAGRGHGASRAIAIQGYCYAPNMVPLEGVDVEWYCNNHGGNPVLVGSDTSNASGYYSINDWGTAHDSHRLTGIAEYYLYENATSEIKEFYYSQIPYDRDFIFTE
jgi:hypothetical protein